MLNDFVKTIYLPRISVDFSNDMIWGDNRVLLSKSDIVVDNAGNEITLYEGLKVYAFEENQEYIGETWIPDPIIANGICVENTTKDKQYCKWLMLIDENGIHYLSEFR